MLQELTGRVGECKGSSEPDAEGCEHRSKEPDSFIYFRRVATTLINVSRDGQEEMWCSGKSNGDGIRSCGF